MRNTTWQDETVQALKQGYQDEIEKLKAELQEEKARNELFENCLHRALKMWQEKNPDADYWISGDKNIVWILEQAETMRAERDAWKQRAEAAESNVRFYDGFMMGADKQPERDFFQAVVEEQDAMNRVVEAAENVLIAYPKAGKELSDAVIVLYDAYNALARVDGEK